MKTLVNKINAVVFDMDGLMFDTEVICRRAHNEAGKNLGIPFADDLYFKSLAMTYENMAIFYSHILNDEQLAKEFVRQISEISMDIYTNEPLGIKPGLFELVDYLERNNYKKAIASSAPMYEISNHLAECGLNDSFKTIVSGHELEHGKPAPDIYLSAASTLNVDPESMLVLEDSIFGIESAYAAKAVPVMIPDLVQPDEATRNKAFCILESLDQVIALLDSQQYIS